MGSGEGLRVTPKFFAWTTERTVLPCRNFRVGEELGDSFRHVESEMLLKVQARRLNRHLDLQERSRQPV